MSSLSVCLAARRMTEKHIYLFASYRSANSQVQVLITPCHHYASRNIKLQNNLKYDRFKATIITIPAIQIYILEIVI